MQGMLQRDKPMDMEAYYHKLMETTLAQFNGLNRTSQADDERVTFSVGRVDSSVARGDILEKAATARIRFKTKNPQTGEDTHFDVFQIKIYPAHPKIPILLFNMENRKTKDDRFGGFLDVAPVATSKEDLNFLQDGIQTIAGRYKEDYEGLRKKVIGIYKRDHWESARNAGIGIRLELTKNQLDFVKEAGLTWVKLYFEIAKKRANGPYGKEEESLIHIVRSRLLEFYMLEDISFRIIQKLGVPLETMARIHFAPVIKY